jgi:hypothetical protein
MDQWPYLMVRDFDGNLLLDNRISFGGVAGCRSFGRPSDSRKEIMPREFDLVHIFCWVDDILFVKLTKAKVQMEEVVLCSAQLGVKTNKKKYLEFSNKQKFIGFIWKGTTKKTMRHPPESREERLQQVERFLVDNTKFSLNKAMVLAGSLNHVT